MTFQTDLILKDFDGLNWLMSKTAVFIFAICLSFFFGGVLFPQFFAALPLLALIMFGIFCAALIVGRFYIHWRSKIIYKRSSVSNSLELVLDEKGIKQTSDVAVTELLWEDVYRVRRNKHCYFVFLNQKQAFYFQKRNLKKGQEETLLAMIRKHVNLKKIKFNI